MAIAILHAHGRYGPNGKTSYLKFATLPTLAEAKKYAKNKLGPGRYKYAPASKVKSMGHSLYYLK